MHENEVNVFIHYLKAQPNRFTLEIIATYKTSFNFTWILGFKWSIWNPTMLVRSEVSLAQTHLHFRSTFYFGNNICWSSFFVCLQCHLAFVILRWTRVRNELKILFVLQKYISFLRNEAKNVKLCYFRCMRLVIYDDLFIACFFRLIWTIAFTLEFDHHTLIA